MIIGITGDIGSGKSTFANRGIRNGGDLSDELTLQSFIRTYADIPCINIFTDTKLAHVSSGAIRQLDKLNVYHSLKIK